MNHPADQYRHHLKPFIISKLEEFKLLGYGEVKVDEFWTYLISKKWKKQKEELQMHEIVSDILSVKANDFMNYATVESFKTSSWMGSEENQRLLKELI
ncbi:post-transcriptional regulator [Metabacillus arenae]|uniref:Post-transcriptional regulator n=1 Tax=Metabacillus arenae TaxID=2771434 RepID=A0A926NJQ4_9BACI|nr:post-transcriptional regulator [Metabacillus arenae]MBD1381233.1 post-transcriptional regulator [Metabacillus arenae]